jgi:hypothetical protein
MDEGTGAVVDALRKRRIHAFRSNPESGFRGVAVSMSANDLERFLDIIVVQPLTEEDWIAREILGSPHELEDTDVPWVFTARPGLSMGAKHFKLHVTVHIPRNDIEEVIRRLESIDPID